MAGVCIVLVLVFVYYVYCLYVTKDIMDYANRVAQGEIVAESRTPYGRFRWKGENDYTYDIKRYFTYCGLTRGRIYILHVRTGLLIVMGNYMSREIGFI